MAATKEDVLPPFDPLPTSPWGATPVRKPGSSSCAMLVPKKQMDFLALLHQEIVTAHTIIVTTGKVLAAVGRNMDAKGARATITELLVSATQQALAQFKQPGQNIVQVRVGSPQPGKTLYVTGTVQDAAFSYNSLHARYELVLTVDYQDPATGYQRGFFTVEQPCHTPYSQNTFTFFPTDHYSDRLQDFQAQLYQQQ